MRRLGGHLGPAVSSLVDGQLDAAAEEQAWSHVVACGQCRSAVEREMWVKDRLARMCGAPPPEHLRPRLQRLSGLPPLAGLDVPVDGQPWEPVPAARSRGRRRAGIAAAGAGSVSAAVLGLTTLGGSPLSLGGATSTPAAPTTGTPAPSTLVPTGLVIEGAPTARADGRLGPRSGRR